MQTHDTDALMQGLLDCGGFEKGQAFIRNHSGEMTGEFVSALRDASMEFLTDRGEPNLALVFADLAFVAATVLGDDESKGMSRYCKGVILARLGDHQKAIPQFAEAQSYLRRGTNTRQVANCLYDQALSHHKLGEMAQPLRLLQEVLRYQSDEKERTNTIAFMLVLEQQRGNLTSAADQEDFIRRTCGAPDTRKVELREATNSQEKHRICDSLARNHAVLQDQELFGRSIPHFLASSDYRFFIAADTTQASERWPPYGYGLVKKYRDNFNEMDLLGLEAACFADLDSRLHVQIVFDLRRMAREQNAWVLCISEKSLNYLGSFRALQVVAGVDTLPSVTMQGARPGIYSAFTDSPGTAAFFPHCLPLRVQEQQWDFDGELASEAVPLYRGEGRKAHASKRERWQVSTWEQLSQYFFTNGFLSRISGVFTGTVQAQLRHQGYVEQPTISLSASADVCAYYATDKHARAEEEGIAGIVFQIDTAGPLKRGRVYDSLATLKKTCPWLLTGFYDQIVRIMCALDSGNSDIRESGAFLERCHRESRRRVESFGGGRTFGPEIDWSTFLGNDMFARLLAHGISKKELDAVNEEFELFWNIALGKMIGMDEIDADGGPSKSVELSRAYFQAFDDVESDLKERWALNRFSRHNDPGWDLSPFGYITKTIRDKEFFSNGDIPGGCILEARFVDRMGVQRNVIRNPNAAIALGHLSE